MKNTSLFAILLLALADSLPGCATEQAAAPSGARPGTAVTGKLFDTIAQLDGALFAAFNAHDIEALMALFADDLEFFHDNGGLTNYRQTKDGFKSLFANNADTGLRRDLVKGSLEVYPIKDYGAIEIGEHRFCHIENGKDDCGTFKFVMVWQRKNDAWKISRVISYDH